MAVLQMQRISIYALKKNRKEILELLQRRGVVEITDLDQKEAGLQKADTSAAQSTFEKNAAIFRQALEILGRYVPEKKGLLSMFEGRTAISLEEYQRAVQRSEETAKAAYQLVALSKEIAEQNAEALRLQTQLDALQPWLGLDVPMRFQGTKQTAAYIGVLPGEQTEEQILAQLAQLAPEVGGISLEVVSAAPEQTCIFLLCAKRDGEAVEQALHGMSFARPPMPTKRAPAQRKRELEQRISEAWKAVAQAEEQIKGYGDRRESFKLMVDYYTMRMEKYRVIEQLGQTRHTFIATGFVPKRDAPALERELTEKFLIAVELEQPGEEEDVPVLLQNNAFAAPVEPVLESYSLPGKGEIDPSGIMAIFYYVLFGMMLSDAAYGLIMVVACGIILHKFKNMETGLRKSIKMFFYCGFSTTFWGVLFGGYFGDVVNVVSRTFFGQEVTIPALWFVPLDEPMRLLVFSFLIGIIHLFTGLGVQLYQLCKGRRYKDALYDVGFWYLLVGGGILFLLSMDMVTDMLGLTFQLPSIVGTISAVCAVAGAVGIVATSGRESRSPIKRFFKGLYGLYNISGYLSDILSYSRLLALGLATGVIASVFNQMGAMVGGGVGGAIVFVLVFAVGQALNMAINLLGAYVHTNRLQYVEFFGKFYEGGGRKFSPFSVKTKYYKFKEEQ